MYEILAVLAGFALLYSLFAGRIQRFWLSGPIVFTAFGVLIGSLGVDLISMERNPELLSTLAELTLALVLFSDASGANLGVLKAFDKLPIRLLAIGLPLTILLGFGAGKLLFGALTVYEIALIATMLAPTDAALGKAVVTNPTVPDPIREGLNIESGLNDGICVPIMLLFLALIAQTGGDQSALSMGMHLVVKVIGVGLLTGVVLTGVAGLLLRFCHARGWLLEEWRGITVIALAFACFGVAQALGGSGFIASFTGGLLFGGLVKSARDELVNSAEGIGDVFALLTWVLFGAVVVSHTVGRFTWEAVVYAVLSLTIVRMLPVWVSVAGLGMDKEGKLFVGWFGPRGLASIVFAVMVIDAEVAGRDTISMVVVITILFSIIAHGVSANPLVKAYAARTGGAST